MFFLGGGWWSVWKPAEVNPQNANPTQPVLFCLGAGRGGPPEPNALVGIVCHSLFFSLTSRFVFFE